MRRFLKWLLNQFGLVGITEDQYKLMLSRADYFEEEYKSTLEYNRAIKMEYDELKAKWDSINGTTILEQKERNDALQIRQDEIQAAMDKAEEYYKSVQETLSRALHDDSVYGFNKAMAFPGSTAVTTHQYTDQNSGAGCMSINGRSILSDQDTAEIRNRASMSEKYQYVFNYLVKYGLIDRIAQMLVNSGAIQFTLAYNTDCTTMEVYYNTQVKIPDTKLIVDLSVK